MRIKRKYFLGKLLLLVLSCAFCVWYFRNDNTRSYTKSDSFRHFGVNPFRFSELSETLTWISKQCVSSVGKVKVTADFTLNDVLDHMTIDRGEMHTIKGVLQSNITKFIHNKISKRYKSEPLEIIVIPHSHNDPGWKKTYMKYFEDQTTHILTNIVEKLTQYPDMTFIWVESCFLDVWWRNQTETMKARFRSLVKSKRLEIVSGMWVAPDEASPHYYQILDQMIEGHYWIKKNLDVVPESSLNFDQFGYSNSIPYLVKKAGLKNVLIKRIHRAVKELMGEKKWMTFQWRQFWDPEGHDDIRGHVSTFFAVFEQLLNSYSLVTTRPISYLHQT